MTVERIKNALTVLDLPSGVVLGVCTLTITGLMIAAFVAKRPIDGSILTAYGVILGAFAIHKTTTATTSIITKSDQGPETPAQ